jgi:AGZA family xanthine/uracil permease-like MFS transporter
MAGATVVALAVGLTTFEGVLSMPPSLAPTFLELDLAAALSPALIDVVFVFFFLALFDSIGSLVALTSRIGVAAGGTFPRARQALLADAAGTVIGAGLGTSTVTAYVESSTGVAAGGRTGLASVVTAGLFLVALFFAPVVKLVAGGYEVPGGITLYPIIAPVLILVGVTMMEGAAKVKWDDFTEAMPAFLAIVITPLAFSITDGIAFGFVAYAVLKPLTGRARELHWLAYVLAALLLLRYAI